MGSGGKQRNLKKELYHTWLIISSILCLKTSTNNKKPKSLLFRSLKKTLRSKNFDYKFKFKLNTLIKLTNHLSIFSSSVILMSLPTFQSLLKLHNNHEKPPLKLPSRFFITNSQRQDCQFSPFFPAISQVIFSYIYCFS